MLKAAGGLGKAAGGLPGLYEKVSSGEAWEVDVTATNDVTSLHHFITFCSLGINGIRM